MAVELILAQEAQQDIEEAYGWFEERFDQDSSVDGFRF